MGSRWLRTSPPLRAAALALRMAIAASAASAVPAAAAPAAAGAAARAFDRDLVHADYQAGDFDKVIRSLERFLDSGRPCGRADSVFAEKHLAVVYAANPATRERGRYHMLRMLALDPRADLLDMFVGEEVDGIFEKVRREARLRGPARPSAAARPNPASSRAHPGVTPRPGKAAARASVPPARLLPPLRPAGPGLEPWSLDPPSERPAGRGSPPAPAPEAASEAKSEIAYPPHEPPAPSVRPASRRPSAATASPDTAARSRWKDPGLWIGGGAAVAVVGLTLFLAGDGDRPSPPSKTYAVPAKPAP